VKWRLSVAWDYRQPRSDLLYYTAKTANDLGIQIATGVIGGNPISTKQRWLMLYSMWMSYEIGGVSMGIFLAIAQALIARNVDDENVKLLAYLAAMIAAVASIMWLLQDALMLLHYRSVLRQAEQVEGSAVQGPPFRCYLNP
jgi:hypothetical protein